MEETEYFMDRLSGKLLFVRLAILDKFHKYGSDIETLFIYDEFKEIYNMLLDIGDFVSEFDSQQKHTEKS
jgi:hypothetical protein